MLATRCVLGCDGPAVRLVLDYPWGLLAFVAIAVLYGFTDRSSAPARSSSSVRSGDRSARVVTDETQADVARSYGVDRSTRTCEVWL
jgi:hypothetical protein